MLLLVSITEATNGRELAYLSHECIGTRTTEKIHRVRNNVKEVNHHGR
jgi:hypothetical protein